MIKEVHYEPHHFKGIGPLLREYPIDRNIRIFGADCETVRGHALSLQIRGPEDELFAYVDGESILPTFLSWVFPRCRGKGVNLVYFHNLRFDLRILFNAQAKAMYEQYHDIRLILGMDGRLLAEDADTSGAVEARIIYGKVNKATLTRCGTTFHIFDSMAFTQASLARSLKMFGVKEAKYEAPEGLGKIDYRLLSPSDPSRKDFEAYSIQDARGERGLGLRIMEFHRDYGVAPSLSLPSFAARVFRKRFMRPTDTIPFPPVEAVKASEFAFHGGKNWYGFDGPRIVEGVYEADISSAYPFAMSCLPGQTLGEFVKVRRFTPGFVGVYKLSGVVAPYTYPLIFDHAFEPLSQGSRFSGLWHGSYEVELILKHNPEVKVVEGWTWHPRKGSRNLFGDYARFFYEKKQSTPKDDPAYHFYKIMLNALFGKTVSTIPVVSDELRDEIRRLQESGVDVPDNLVIDERWDEVLGKYIRVKTTWKAGAFYNPFWGALITSHTRAYLYGLETKYHGLHSATDAVKTTSKVQGSKGLGGLNIEAHGRCYFLRNKLYLHMSDSFKFCGHDKKKPPCYPKGHKLAGQSFLDKDGQHLCKVALHGFKGPLALLWERRHDLIKTRSLSYSYDHVVGLREGLKREETPGDFVEREETLRI